MHSSARSNEESPGFLCTDSKDAVRASDFLDADQKVDALDAVIRSGVARATTEAMAN